MVPGCSLNVHGVGMPGNIARTANTSVDVLPHMGASVNHVCGLNVHSCQGVALALGFKILSRAPSEYAWDLLLLAAGLVGSSGEDLYLLHAG